MAKLNKRQANIIRRLSKLSGKTLQRVSKETHLFSYQRGVTKHGLQKIARSTKNKNILTALEDVVSVYERYGTEDAISTALKDIYVRAPESIQRFIRIQQFHGWEDHQILVAVTNSYDLILYMASEDMMRLETYDIFWDEVQSIEEDLYKYYVAGA